LVSNNISQKAEQFSEVVKEQLAEQELAHQKELEIQQQTEILQKATEIEEKLKAAQDSLGDDSPSAKWKEMDPDKRSSEDYATNVPQRLKK